MRYNLEGNERGEKKRKSPERVVHDQATSNDRKHGRVLGLVPVRCGGGGMKLAAERAS